MQAVTQNNTHRLRGLYAITDDHLILPGELINSVEQAILGGCRMVQYRSKNPHRDHTCEAGQLHELCRSHRIPLIINDDVQLAKRVGAEGVHLGMDDLDYKHARQILGQDAIIGVSCYNSLDRALEAQQSGASYIAFGSFFPSHTKPHAVTVGLDLVRLARKQIGLPIIAIGGINADNGAPLLAAGIDMLAVISDLFGQADVRQASQRLSALF